MKRTDENEVIMGLLGKNFLYSLMFGENFRWEYETIQRVLGLGQYGCVLVLACSRKSRIGEESVKNHAQSLAHCVADALKQTVCHVLTGPYILGRISIYLDLGGRDIKSQERFLIQDICRNALASGESGSRLAFGIGIGGSRPIEDAYHSYLEALDCLGYLENGTVIAYEDIMVYKASRIAGDEKRSCQELAERLLERVGRGNAEAAVWFQEWLNCMQPLSLIERKNKILEITVLASEKVQEAGSLKAESMDYIAYAKEIESLGWEELKETAQMQMDALIKAARFTRKIVYSELVTQAIQYIRKHYKNEITLQEVADELGVTPQYLSKLFKKETGENYIDFLTHYRIGKAKEYLLTGKVRIREAGYLVGIQDPNYFSRLFKKIEGVSPSEYTKGNMQ